MTGDLCSSTGTTPQSEPDQDAVRQARGGVMIYVLKACARLDFVSDSYCAMTRYSRDALAALVARSPLNLVLPADHPAMQEAIRLLHSEERCLTIDYRLIRGDGVVRRMHDAVSSVRGANGQMQVFVISQDVTKQQASEQAREAEARALRENEKFLRAFMALSDRITARYDIEKKVLEFEQEFAEKRGIPIRYENVPECFLQTGGVFADTRDEYIGLFAEIATGKQQGCAVIHLKNYAGSILWCEVRYSTFFDENQRPETAVLSFLDVTAQRDREIAYQRYVQEVLGAHAEDRAYIEVNLSADFVEKQGAGKLFHRARLEGKSYTEVLRQMLTEFAADGDSCYAALSRDHLLTVFADGTTTVQEKLAVRLPGGGEGWVSCQVQMATDPFTQAVRAYIVVCDITREKQEELDLQKRAEQDGMTGVYNRVTVETMIRRAIDENPGMRCALLILDIDDLKTINDHCGHICGDTVIRSVAGTLRGFFRSTDLVGRIGGDEFVVFVRDAPEEQAIRRKLEQLVLCLSAQEIGNELFTHCSVGCALGVCGQSDFDALYTNADIALYHVKRHGKHGCAVFERGMKNEKA